MWYPYAISAKFITEERVLLAAAQYKGGVSTMIDRQYHLNFEYTTIHLQINNSFSINSYLPGHWWRQDQSKKSHTLPHHHPHKQEPQKHPLYIVLPSLLRNSTQESRLLHRPVFRVYILSHALHFSSIATMRLSALLSLLFSAAVYGQSGRKQTFDSMNLLWYQHFIVAPKKFLTLPLGQVRPVGWLLDQVFFFAR